MIERKEKEIEGKGIRDDKRRKRDQEKEEEGREKK